MAQVVPSLSLLRGRLRFFENLGQVKSTKVMSDKYQNLSVGDGSVTSVKLEVGSIGLLEGKMLTIVDASINDPIQRKALKDIVRQSIWEWANGWHFGFTEEQWKANQELTCTGK